MDSVNGPQQTQGGAGPPLPPDILEKTKGCPATDLTTVNRVNSGRVLFPFLLLWFKKKKKKPWENGLIHSQFQIPGHYCGKVMVRNWEQLAASHPPQRAEINAMGCPGGRWRGSEGWIQSRCPPTQVWNVQKIIFFNFSRWRDDDLESFLTFI